MNTLKILLLAFILIHCGNQSEKVSDIQCILSLDKTTFKIDETVFVNITIKNNTNKEIVICGAPSLEKLVFSRIINGERKSTVDIADFEKPTDRNLYIVLPPKDEHKFWGPTEFGDEYFNETGKWGLRIIREYNFKGEDFGLNAWTGVLESNDIELQIIE